MDTEWYEVHSSVSEEKVKQALREKAPGISSSECSLKRSLSGSPISPDVTSDDESTATLSAPESLPNLSAHASSRTLASDPRGETSTTLDPRLMLFQGDSLRYQHHGLTDDLQQQFVINALLASSPLDAGGALSSALQHEVTTLISINIAAAVAHQRSLADAAVYSMLRDVSCLQMQNSVADPLQTDRNKLDEALSESLVVKETKSGISTLAVEAKTDEVDDEDIDKLQDTSEEDATQPSEADEQEEVAAFLLSSLALANRPIITSEQKAKET